MPVAGCVARMYLEAAAYAATVQPESECPSAAQTRRSSTGPSSPNTKTLSCASAGFQSFAIPSQDGVLSDMVVASCHWQWLLPHRRFIKIGTFYELYEDDAQIGVDVLNFKMTITGVGHCRQVICWAARLIDLICHTAPFVSIAGAHAVSGFWHDDMAGRWRRWVVPRAESKTPASGCSPRDTRSEGLSRRRPQPRPKLDEDLRREHLHAGSPGSLSSRLQHA